MFILHHLIKAKIWKSSPSYSKNLKSSGMWEQAKCRTMQRFVASSKTTEIFKMVEVSGPPRLFLLKSWHEQDQRYVLRTSLLSLIIYSFIASLLSLPFLLSAFPLFSLSSFPYISFSSLDSSFLPPSFSPIPYNRISREKDTILYHPPPPVRFITALRTM